MNLLIHKHFDCSCTLIHNIDFSNNSNCSLTIFIPLSGQLQTIRNSQVLVSRNYTQDNRLRILAIKTSHLSCQLFYILLPLHIDSGDSRQIDNGEIRTIVGVNTQFDGIIDDVSILTSYIVSQLLNVHSHVPKIRVSLTTCIILKNRVRLAIALP